MGLRSPFGYVGYEGVFTELYIKMLDDLCLGCHTNRDYKRGCRDCPAGRLMSTLKVYVLNAEEADKKFKSYAGWPNRSKKEAAMDRRLARLYKPKSDAMRRIKQYLKLVRPAPLYNINFLSRRKKRKDDLAELRKALSDFQHLEGEQLRDFRLESHLLKLAQSRLKEDVSLALLESMEQDGI